MITFTESLERAKSKGIAIHTPTEKQAKALLKAFDEKGYKWTSGVKLTTKAFYEFEKENTCYNFEPNKEVWYCALDWYQYKGYTIIEFEDIDFKENA